MKNPRPVRWMGDSLDAVRAFPEEVQKDMGDDLQVAQYGGYPASAKPFKGVGSGVYELAERYDKEAYRVVYAVKIDDHVYVLHAFHKKSKSGISTPKKDVDMIKRRYNEAVADAAERKKKG